MPLNSSSGYASVASRDGVVAGSMFYWHFPSRNGDLSAPLILWLQGGPGSSGIEHGLLRINGPVRLDDDSAMYERPVGDGSWSDEFNVVYVDNPIGTGYSFVSGDESDVRNYATNQDQVSDCLLDLLNHLYDVGLADRSSTALFVAGESYGGHYIPALGAKILSSNAAGLSSIPLRGVLIGDGLTDPGLQELTKPIAAYNFGLIDLHTMGVAQVHSARAWAAVQAGDYGLAKTERETMEGLVADFSRVNLYDVRTFEQYDSSKEVAWLNDAKTKEMLGVDAKRTFGTNANVGTAMNDDVMKSYKNDVKKILDADLPVLLYQGQFDWKDGASSNELWVATLGLESYLNDTRRVLYRAEGDKQIPYGWIKGTEILKDAVIQNAGHMVPADAPLAAFDIMKRFVRGEL